MLSWWFVLRIIFQCVFNGLFWPVHTGTDNARQAVIYLYMFLIGGTTWAYKEHISLLPLAAPCRFPCEQTLSRIIFKYVSIVFRIIRGGVLQLLVYKFFLHRSNNYPNIITLCLNLQNKKSMTRYIFTTRLWFYLEILYKTCFYLLKYYLNMNWYETHYRWGHLHNQNKIHIHSLQIIFVYLFEKKIIKTLD